MLHRSFVVFVFLALQLHSVYGNSDDGTLLNINKLIICSNLDGVSNKKNTHNL